MVRQIIGIGSLALHSPMAIDRTVPTGAARLQNDRQIEQGLVLQRRGDLAAAEAIYNRLLEKPPAHPQALHYLGLLRFQQDRLQEARQLTR
jgi:Flp pilus assembly protein TadD